ncbi:MAG: TraR/DksA family transcriptional regulator [Deltaproteobacteria bacterium]|nr:TraR/DksA family transcriptional regulator [Deltaproteobacteria bacterium]
MGTDAIRERLRQELLGLIQRNAKIAANLRREQNPLGGDWTENAAVLENDEVLDALDAEGRARATQLRAALDRIAAGTYGTCVRCRGPIHPGRLEAIPEVTTCIDCARAA